MWTLRATTGRGRRRRRRARRWRVWRVSRASALPRSAKQPEETGYELSSYIYVHIYIYIVYII